MVGNHAEGSDSMNELKKWKVAGTAIGGMIGLIVISFVPHPTGSTVLIEVILILLGVSAGTVIGRRRSK